MARRIDLAGLVADAASGATIQLPAGQIVLDAPLVIDRRLTIRGKKTILVGKSGVAVLLIGKKGQVVVEGLSIVRRGTAPGHVIRCYGALTLRSCMVRGGRKGKTMATGAGLVLEGGARATLDRCAFPDNGLVSVLVNARSRLVARNTTCRKSISGFYIDGGHAVLERNVCEDMFAAAIVWSARGAGSARRNRCTRCGTGVYVEGKSTPTIEKNICEHVELDGIFVGGTAGATVVDNRVEHAKRDGISLNGRARAIVRGNRVVSSKHYGISVFQAAEVEATGNVVERNELGGIHIASRARGRYGQNRAVANKGHGVLIDGRGEAVLQQNVCQRNEHHGILVTDGSRPTLDRNVLEANVGAGIEYWNRSGGIAKSNVCRKNGNSGICLSGGVAPQLVENECISNDGEGIALDEDIHGVRPKATLRDNVSRGNSEDGGRGTQVSWQVLSKRAVGTVLARYAKAAWVPKTKAGDGSPTSSKFGGTPCLGSDEAWPRCGDCAEPMPLVLQLDLASLPKDAGNLGKGIVQLFLCHEDGLSNFGPKSHLLRLVPKRAKPAAVRPPKCKGAFPPRRIEGFTKHGELVRWTEVTDKERKRIARDANAVGLAYFDGDEDVGSGPNASSAGGDKLLGWPCWIYEGATPSRCHRCRSPLRHLFQLDAETNVPWSWGDAGKAWLMQCPKHPDVLLLDYESH